MALINTNIQKILREAGIDSSQSNTQTNNETNSNQAQLVGSKEKTDLELKLEAVGLSLDEVLGDLSHIARMGGSEAIRLRALENALKAHGINKDQTQAMPTINIIIVDGQKSPENDFNETGINPILIPRKLQEKEKIQ